MVRVLGAATGMHRALFAVAIGQGCRPGEVVILDWKDVDWARGMIRFQAFQGRKKISGKNKRSDKWVPVTGMTSDHLLAWWESCGRPTEGHVFTWHGKAFDSWKVAWHGVVERSGINPGVKRKIVPCSARYTYCSL